MVAEWRRVARKHAGEHAEHPQTWQHAARSATQLGRLGMFRVALPPTFQSRIPLACLPSPHAPRLTAHEPVSRSAICTFGTGRAPIRAAQKRTEGKGGREDSALYLSRAASAGVCAPPRRTSPAAASVCRRGRERACTHVCAEHGGPEEGPEGVGDLTDNSTTVVLAKPG